jgi:hypothetical protein
MKCKEKENPHYDSSDDEEFFPDNDSFRGIFWGLLVLCLLVAVGLGWRCF